MVMKEEIIVKEDYDLIIKELNYLYKKRDRLSIVITEYANEHGYEPENLYDRYQKICDDIEDKLHERNKIVNYLFANNIPF